MTIGQRIKTLRKAMGLTQGELAKKLGIAQSLIAYLEGGKGTGTTHIASIARALNVNALWLETGEGSQELDYILPVGKNYCIEIEQVIRLMESTDDRGREKAIIAVKDALDLHHAWRDTLPLPRTQEAPHNGTGEVAAIARALLNELLPKALEAEKAASDVYQFEDSEALLRRKNH